MAACRVLSRLSSRLPSLNLKFNFKPISSPASPFKANSFSSSAHPLSSPSRLPGQIRCLATMMPLHSAIASARLTSVLSAESQSWGLIPQGNSIPL